MNIKKIRAGGMTQAAECLPSKHDANEPSAQTSGLQIKIIKKQTKN
jgi:hypothetical protein